MKFYLYGAGNNCRSLLKLLKKTRIEALIDKDVDRCGKEVNGIPIISFREFLINKEDSYVFVTTVYYDEEIIELFNNNGVINYGFCPWLEKCYTSIEEIISLFKLNSKEYITFLSNNPITNEIIHTLDNKTIKVYYANEKKMSGGTDIYVTEKHISNYEKNNNYIDIIQTKELPKRKELLKFRNIHKNDRCFIIGNGPSLLYKDLELLKKRHEICFGVNRVYLGYHNTNWRPDYYVVVDNVLLTQDINNIIKLEGIKFLRSRDEIKNAYCFNNIAFNFKNSNFSLDIVDGIYNGFTVIYECIQIAVYMGFKTIYLLGVDMPKQREDYAENGMHFYQSPNVNENLGKGNREGAVFALGVAKKNAEQLGVKIYNATRGGELDVFERVNIDLVLRNKEG